jgi:hypothetical protein
MGQIGCPETSVNNYQSTPHNIPEELRSHLDCGGSLKSRIDDGIYAVFNDEVCMPACAAQRGGAVTGHSIRNMWKDPLAA